MTSKTDQPTVNVFVYGTLKKGFKLHDWMNGSKFVESDWLYGHTLIDLGPYPAMVKIEALSQEFKTQGEVYAMPAEYFRDLQLMEENVGYRTVDIVTSKGHQAKSFIFANLASGIAKWIPGEDGGKARVEVMLDDEIPF